MEARALVCPSCGGPLPAYGWRALVTCTFCGVKLQLDRRVVRASRFADAVEQNREHARQASTWIEVGGRTYALGETIATGDSTDVLRGSRELPAERVIVKVLRAATDADLFTREGIVLRDLRDKVFELAPAMAGWLPQTVAEGVVTRASASFALGVRLDEHRLCPARVLRARPGFDATFEDVRRVHGDALDPRHLVWLWRRVLELLRVVHAAGFVHGALVARHLLVNARDHGVFPVGFACAARIGEPLVACRPGDEHFYRPEVIAGAGLARVDDLIVSARTMGWLFGATSPAAPSSLPAPLADLVKQASAGNFADAAPLHEELTRRGRALFGPPAFVPLDMPL